jgi:signal transduction histidine kinase/CheY-like chemotaxis protein
MTKKTEHLKLRVILGYISMLVVVIAAIIHISNLITRIIEEESKDDLIREKSHIITKTLLILYECEIHAQFANEENEEFAQFNHTLDKVLEQLNLLSTYSADSAQGGRIGDLKSLLEQKRENMGLLLNTRQEMERLYSKHIADGMAANRELAKEVEVQMQEETQRQTILMQRQKKGFFKRLAEAFVPLKEDTGIFTNAISRMQTDSLINEYNPSDTIAYVLSQIQSEINKEYNSLNLILDKRATDLRKNNSIITGKINQILFEIESEWTNSFLEQEIHREEIIRNTTKSLAIIAFASLIIVLLFLYLILRDIARSRFYRQQLEVAKQLAEDLLQSREMFMLMISHDIRAPLSSILGYLELLKQSPYSEEQECYLANITVSSRHILSLVNDLLDFYRLESGQVVIRPAPFNVFALFEEIYSEYKPLTDAKGLTFCLHTESLHKPDVCIGDSIRIRQAVGNLLSNAIKFTVEGTVSLIVSSLPAEKLGEKRFFISIKDEGLGIAESEWDVIFKEFTRLAKNEKVEGFGLGLSITCKLVSLMGGTISLNSTVGEGSEFIISLLLPLSEEEPAVAKNEETTPLVVAKQNINCLVIDDDMLQLKFTEEALKRNYVNVTALSDPNDAITLLETSTSFDVILTDIQMPLLDGYALLEHIRSLEIASAERIPVIALSASLAEKQEHYLKAGFSGFLSKPFTVEELITLLNNLFPVRSQTEAPLNFAALTSFAGNDRDASTYILRTFSEETKKSIALLQEALKSKDRPQVANLSHKLIPLFAMLEAHTLVQLLRILEANDESLSEDIWLQTLESAIACTIQAIGQIDVE